MIIKMEQSPSITLQMEQWLWDAYSTQTPVELEGVKFSITNMETVGQQLIVELTPYEDIQPITDIQPLD